MEKVHKYDHIN